jgi:hypothetical protein
MSTPTPTTIIRAFDAIQPRQLFLTFHAQFPYDRIGAIWREMERCDGTTTRLLLREWIPGRYHVAPKGTYAHLLDYPGIRVSLMNGGVFDGWGKRRGTRRWGVFLTAAIIFGKMPEEFPEVFEKVWGTLERIRSGELRFPESSPEEIRADFVSAKAELFPALVRTGLMTMVARKAPTAKRLWKALPAFHAEFPSPAYLLDFLRKCSEWENETVFRVTEKRYGRENVRLLLEAIEGNPQITPSTEKP